MDEMIGYCGYNCHLCPARSDDREERQKLVDGWRKFFGHEMYTADNVRCDGCRADGRLADKGCRARPCARQKELDSCAACADFPCDRVHGLISSRGGLLLNCCARHVAVTTEEYDRCLRQFDSLPNILRVLAEQGRIPNSLLDRPRPDDQQSTTGQE